MTALSQDAQWSLETDRAHHVAYSLHALGDIASHYDRAVDDLERNEYPVASYMTDAFYVHLRLLADFLVKSTHAKDFGPEDFGVHWVIPQTPEALELAKHWHTASSYVVHFSDARVLHDLDAFPIGGILFNVMAKDALLVFREFLKKLEKCVPEGTAATPRPNPQIDPDTWRLHVQASQSVTIRAAFDDAAEKIGLA